MFLINKMLGTKMDKEGSQQINELGAWKTALLMLPCSKEPWYLKWKEFNTVMWLGHFTFIAGVICYLEGPLVDLVWGCFLLVNHIIPGNFGGGQKRCVDSLGEEEPRQGDKAQIQSCEGASLGLFVLSVCAVGFLPKPEMQYDKKRKRSMLTLT